MMDLEVMGTREAQMKYIVLAREDLINQDDEMALRNKTITVVCKFHFGDVMWQNECVGIIIVDREELNANDAREVFHKSRSKSFLSQLQVIYRQMRR